MKLQRVAVDAQLGIVATRRSLELKRLQRISGPGDEAGTQWQGMGRSRENQVGLGVVESRKYLLKVNGGMCFGSKLPHHKGGCEAISGAHG